ncbi:MAG: ATP-binding protein [Chloroflexota bacterium]
MTDAVNQPVKTPRFPYPRISVRVTGPFLIAIIVVAALGSFTVTRLVAGSIQERFNNQMAASASAASNTITDVERRQLSVLRSIVFTEGVAAAVTANDTANLDLWLRPLVANAALDELVVFDNTGSSVFELQRIMGADRADYSIPKTPTDLSAWTGVGRVVDGIKDNQGDKFVDVIGQPPDTYLYLTAPITDENGVTVGGASIGMTMTNLARRIGEQALSGITLFDQKGTVLGSTFRSANFDLLALSETQAAQLLTEVAAITPVREMPRIEGIPYQALYASFQIRNQPIGLIAIALPSNFLVEQSGTSRDIFSVLFSIMFAGVALLGLFIARSITKPVARLVDTTRAIRDGDLTRRVNLKTPDELGELGVSFDHMTDQLIARNQEINKLYLEQLEEAARREAILVSIGDAVVVLNPEGRTILRNYAADQLIDQAARHPHSKRQLGTLFQSRIELIEPRIVDIMDKSYSVQATPVKIPSGDLLGHVMVFRDITEIIAAERAKDEMILQLSHELRTPMTTARGYVELAKFTESSNLSEQGKTFLANATVGLTTLERMINQVVDVSTILAHRFSVSIEQINLCDVLRERYQYWLPIVEGRSQTLSLNMLPDNESCIEGDRVRIAEVMDHLLRNAYSYTLADGWIGIQTERKSGQIAISVIDSGVGIEKDEINRVFERMYRGRSAEAGPTDARGLGLGLYIAKEIVEQHHGTIEIESQLDVGTVVTVRLPIRHDKP